MNKLTTKSQMMRGIIIRDVARAYAPNPAATYSKQELQEKCKNFTVDSNWLQKLQLHGILMTVGTRRNARYALLARTEQLFNIRSQKFINS
jgi:hypothetical protein